MNTREMIENVTDELRNLAQGNDMPGLMTGTGFRITLNDEHSTALTFRGVTNDELKMTLEFYPALPRPGTMMRGSAQTCIARELRSIADMLESLPQVFVPLGEL